MLLIKTKSALLKKAFWLTASLALVLAGSQLFSQPSSSATNLSNFNPGNIISDGVMGNYASMTEAEIQTFLKSKNRCNDTNISKAKLYPHLQYNIRDGRFVCMADESFGGESAAKIIWQAAQDYKINPQVLIVLLQKEQGLVTDTWPNHIQYRSATGYGCPDTADCDARYYGFKNQVRWAASLFRTVLNGGWTNYPVGDNYVQYNPNKACGGSIINIENRATSALYRYTPYQPNPGALAAGYGAAPCGAYGNRNFYLYFTDWFGDNQGTPFFRFENEATVYILGVDRTYYRVPSPEALKEYGVTITTTTLINTYKRVDFGDYVLKGDLPNVARFEGIGVYLISDNKAHPFPDPATLNAYGFNFGDEAFLPSWVLGLLKPGNIVRNIIRLSDDPSIYQIIDGKKQGFCNWETYTQSGSPAYSTLPFVTLNKYQAGMLKNGAPIASNGNVIYNKDDDTYWIWQDGSLRPFNKITANNSGLPVCASGKTELDQTPKLDAPIENLIKLDNKNYIIDSKKLISLSDDDLANLKIDETSFAPVPPKLTEKLTTSSLSPVYRVNQSDTVNKIIGNNSYSVPSPGDLYGLGHNFNEVISINEQTKSLFNAKGVVYKPGRLIRIGQGDGVYLLDDNFKRYAFTSADTFLNYGYKWTDVVSITENNAISYSTVSKANQFVLDKNGSTWLVDKGVKRKVPNDLASSKFYNLEAQALSVLSELVINQIPSSPNNLNQVIRSEQEDSVYLIENGTKRAFTSAQAFLSRGFTWAQVTSLSKSLVSSFKTGKPIY